MEMPLVLIDDDGIRPAGKPDECFYCNSKIGTSHKNDCQVVKKIILAKYTYEIQVKIPHWWGVEEFEFHRNESSWCASNARCDIDRHVAVNDLGCPCACFTAEYVEDIDSTPRSTSRADVDAANKKVADYLKD